MNAFPMLARYNQWANRRLYDAAAALPDEDLRADLGAAFGSILGTLNHIVVADLIWMSRFAKTPPPDLRLDTTVSDDLSALRQMREALDVEIVTFFDRLTEDDVASTFTYTRAISPDVVTEPMGPALVHVFNHQTHHRGQVHALLTRLTGEAPSLDLIYFARLPQVAA